MPDGSRIGMQATQGDAHGGAIVAWTIIGGGQGFTVTPAQFLFRDGYTNLAKDPNAKKPTGTYDYVPGGTAAAAWGA